MSGIHSVPTDTLLGRSMTAKDMTNGMVRYLHTLTSEIMSQSPAPIARLLPHLHHLLLDLRRRLVRTIMGSAGSSFKTLLPLGSVATHPFANHVPRRLPPPGRLAQIACLFVALDQQLSCFDAVHTVYSPVGQSWHSRSSSWMSVAHTDSTGGRPAFPIMRPNTW